MSLEPSSPLPARGRASTRAIRERTNSIRACYGSASSKANRSFRPLQGPASCSPRTGTRNQQARSRGRRTQTRRSCCTWLRVRVSRARPALVRSVFCLWYIVTGEGTDRGPLRAVPSPVFDRASKRALGNALTERKGGVADGNRHREVVQPREGLRLHHSR